MERLNAIGRIRATRCFLEGAQRPCVTDGRALDGGSILGPTGNEKRLKGVPKEEDVEFGGAAGRFD